MKIYVATSFKNIPEARQVMAALRKAGHEISHDWTNEAVDQAWPLARRLAYLRKCGSADYAGVQAADAVVLINHDLARDAMVEFGLALGMSKPVFLLYPERRTSVFFHFAKAWCFSVNDLLAALAAY